MKPAFDLSVYLVLDPLLCGAAGVVETARAAVAGGVTMVQLRDKAASRGALIETGCALKAALAGTPARLIINDHAEVAVAVGADGVHVGQADAGTREVRACIGPDMLLGVSVHRPGLAADIDPELVDYAGIGPVFATPTKPHHEEPTGFAGLARIIAACPVPAVAIGGLKRQHVAGVMATGAGGIAVVSAICGTADPRLAARALAAAVQEARH